MKIEIHLQGNFKQLGKAAFILLLAVIALPIRPAYAQSLNHPDARIPRMRRTCRYRSRYSWFGRGVTRFGGSMD